MTADDEQDVAAVGFRETRAAQVEGLKALADWSKWLISIESGLSAAILIALEGQIVVRESPALIAALVCFFISIVAAASLLAAIPHALQKTSCTARSGASIHSIQVYEKHWILDLVKAVYWLKLVHCAFVEHFSFLVALVCLGVAIARNEFQSPLPG